MIQRIQSILMLLASGFLGLEFVFPFASTNQVGSGYFSDTIFNIFDNNILLGIVVLGAVLCIVSIFLFKNRKLQTSINWLTVLLCIGLLGASYLLLSGDQSGSLSDADIGIGSFLPVVSLILLLVSNRFINKDENLVKSMDRLR